MFDSVSCWPWTPGNQWAIVPCFTEFLGINYDSSREYKIIIIFVFVFYLLEYAKKPPRWEFIQLCVCLMKWKVTKVPSIKGNEHHYSDNVAFCFGFLCLTKERKINNILLSYVCAPQIQTLQQVMLFIRCLSISTVNQLVNDYLIISSFQNREQNNETTAKFPNQIIKINHESHYPRLKQCDRTGTGLQIKWCHCEYIVNTHS